MSRTALALARTRSNEGDAEGALSSLREAEALADDDPGTWREIGQLHAEYWRWEDANRALERAAALDPTHAGAAALHAIVKQESGDDTGALERLERAAAHNPGDLGLELSRRLYLPQVYVDAAEPGRWRARFEHGLGDLEADLERLKGSAGQVFDLNRTNFLLAYQGEDDLELQRRHSRLLGALARHARPDWTAPRPPRYDGSRRLRVGFAASIFRDCTAGRYFERWITRLDPRRFERVVYHTAPLSDEVTRRIAASADRFVTLRENGEACIERISGDQLDVLVQPEVGMTPLSYLLAALRVAPVQCAGWGHPVTTGGEGVDAYFTCGAMEPPDGAAHYSERLVPLPGLGVSYPMPEPAPPFPREKLRLPLDRRLYVCPQSLFKIHPEMDAIFARLLEADPAGAIVFFQAPARAVTERFAARVQRAIAARGVAPGSQLKFLPRNEHHRVPPCAGGRRRGHRHASLVGRQHEPGRDRLGNAGGHLPGPIHARAPDRGDAAHDRARGAGGGLGRRPGGARRLDRARPRAQLGPAAAHRRAPRAALRPGCSGGGVRRGAAAARRRCRALRARAVYWPSDAGVSMDSSHRVRNTLRT
jgi:CRISPR-associated protein Csy1